MIITALLLGLAAPVAVYAGSNGSITMNKNAIELYIGEKYQITVKNGDGAVWSSSDPSVVLVDNEGNLFGASAGIATVKAEKDGNTAECTVYVVEKEYSFDDNIMISIFWPPTQGYVNDEQYKYMADAGITYVMGAGDNIGSKSVQLKMLELCYKYGIHMTVGDDRLGGNLPNMTEKRIKAVMAEYKNIPAANGFYMLDEPYNPNIFIDAYKVMKEADPGSYMHLNFLPYAAYPNIETYESQMNDWLKLCEATGYPQDYLMYDLYPFGISAGSMNRTGFLINMDAVRKVGLANGVKTATYIQSVCIPGAYRSLTRAETLYEINMALAFGIKQLSYFTWFTPKDRSEPFEDGIISSDGKPNKKYEFICELDRKVLTVGKTLVKCDALEVYESSNSQGSTVERIPDDFFVHTVNKRDDFTVSYLRSRENGRNYCMVVNNSFSGKKQLELVFDDAIKSLEYLSYDDGELHPLEMSGSKVETELEAGGAIIIALPEGYDYSAKAAAIPDAGTNLAKDAQVCCDTSEGANGWYMDNLNDGKRFSGTADNGWKTNNKTGLGQIVVDLGASLEFNRIDLYPAGSADEYGKNMPKAFKISYSADKETWYEIAEAADFAIINNIVPSLKFDKVEGRYVKIEITEANGKVSELCEIEIYNDDGSVPEPDYINKVQAPAQRGTYEIRYKAGSNIALNKSVKASTAPEGGDYKVWGWWPDYVCDGNVNTGWTSNVKIHMGEPNSTEYCIIDLGDTFSLSDIKVIALGCWPVDFDISVSTDQSEWTTLCEEKNSSSNGYELSVDGNVARYVRFKGTKLRNTAADGYMLQLAEIEVYGKPYKNAAEAEELIAKYVQAGGSEESDSCKAVKETLSDENKTQSQLDKKLAAMLNEVGLKIPEPEQEATPTADYKIDYKNERPAIDTEPVTEPATEPAETEEKAETPEDKATEPLTEKPVGTEGGDSYLGLKIAAVALAVLAAGAALAFVLIKRRKK